MTTHQMKRIGRMLKSGDARIVGLTTSESIFPGQDDSNQSYIIEDLERQETAHVPCYLRPSWDRYVKS